MHQQQGEHFFLNHSLTSTVASTSPRTAVEPILHESPLYMVTGRDSPVRADWSTSRRPSLSRQSAGIAEPAPSSTMSPGTSILASIFCQLPSRLTVAVGLREAFRAATASAALMVSYLHTQQLKAAAGIRRLCTGVKRHGRWQLQSLGINPATGWSALTCVYHRRQQ